jgi:hypothetical protein
MKIIFGAMAEPLHIQIGYKFKNYKHVQKDADAVTRLLVRGLIGERQGKQIRFKIMKNLILNTNLNKGKK